MQRKLYVVAYDVRKPSRLAATLRVVKGYASGGQKSAYECWLSNDERQALQKQLENVLDLSKDSVAFLPLELRQPVSTLGVAIKPVDPVFYYIG